MTEQVGNQSVSNKPWETNWSHSALYNARENASSQTEQNYIANAEHRAFAREVTAENPAMAIPLLAAIPAYQGAKALGLTNSRSEPSLEQASEAYKGVGEGLSEGVLKPWERGWNEVKQATTQVGAEIATTITNKLPWLVDWATPPTKQYPNEAAPRQPSSSVFEQVFNRLVGTESKGQHTDAQGNLTKSSKGALGITQVLPKVAADPGYGVKPLQNDTEKEYLRFGKDYLKAMLKEFDNDYEKALAAYNGGVGTVKRAITKGGDDWKSKLPKETQNYITKILGSK